MKIMKEADHLGLKLNDYVQVAPDDNGASSVMKLDFNLLNYHFAAKKFPTVGKLVGFNKEEVVIEVEGLKGLLRCHFPQLTYTITISRPHKL